MAAVGYARVSTDDQNLGPQLDSLRVAGCETIFEEYVGAGPIVTGFLPLPGHSQIGRLPYLGDASPWTISR